MADKLLDPIIPQAVVDQEPIGNNMSLRDIQKLMKKDPNGHHISSLGYDGVLRTFDNERNILDAVGLNPTQIREYYDGLPIPERLLTADGRNISRWDMFHPDAENIPRKFTEEDKAKIRAYNEELEKRGVTCCIPGKSADDGLRAIIIPPIDTTGDGVWIPLHLRRLTSFA